MFLFLATLNDETDVDISQCKCEQWQKCSWGKKALNIISGLPPTHPSHRSLGKFFRDRICDFGDRYVQMF